MFWLALIATAVATALSFQRVRADREVAAGPPVRLAADLAAATLRHGGVAALRDWLGEAERTRGAALLAVDARGEDLLGRPVPAQALEEARQLAAGGTRRRAARLVRAPTGEEFLLFAPASGEPRRGGRRGGAPGPWVLMAAGALASLAASALLAWYFARPIRHLRWAFRAAAEGRLETRVRPLMRGRRDEIADLGGDFDAMAQQLQKLVAAQRRLLHDVSHELRSPLARLQAAVGLIRQDPGRLEASLERIEREVARLDALVGEVLTLARLEGGTAAGAVAAVDLADLVANVAADARFEAQAAGRGVQLDSIEELQVPGRAELLHRAIENVVRNAVKHTGAGTTVEIRLARTADQAQLSVRDRGPGVGAEHLERIFEPFYRAGGSGFGLGLAIAQRAILAHGGTIGAENAPGGGLRVEIQLPLAQGNASA